MKPKGFLVTVISLLVLLGMVGAACAPAATPTPVKVAPTPTPLPPIKIGMTMPLTSYLAQVGEETTNGFKLYLEQIGYQSGGRSLKLILEDTASEGATGLTKVRKLVELDKVDLLFVGFDDTAVASRDYIDAAKKPTLVNTIIKSLTQERMSPYIFRHVHEAGQVSRPQAPYAYDEMNVRTVAVVIMDFQAVREMAEGFQEVFTALGGKVVTVVNTPPGTMDYLPYLMKLADVKADALLASILGADAARFVKQYGEMGLKAKLPLIGTGGLLEESLLEAEGEAAVGAINSVQWLETLDNPENKRFVELYKAKYGTSPSGLAQNGWNAALIFDNVIKAVNGNVEDTEGFLRVMKGLNIRTPKGVISFDDHNNIVQDVYLVRVERVGGAIQRVLIKTIPKVDQFWMPPKK